MIIKKFSAASFRNIESCSIEFKPGLNLLHGKNAQGKTNALEGIYIFSRGKSFRARDDRDLVKFGSQGFRLKIEFEDITGDTSLEYSMHAGERQRRKNGYKLKGPSEMIGSFRSVLFYPDNLEIVKGGPEMRREFLNIAIAQCNPTYIKYYSDYKKALENRNCLLKAASKGLYYTEDEILSWSQSMAEYASYIYILRADYIKRIAPFAKRTMEGISEGEEQMELSYISDIEEELFERDAVREKYISVFTSSLEREKAAGVSLFGPHRDDIKISVNGNDTRHFASQGQQRSAVLALKLSEGEVIKELCGEYPVYLFDDVLSELDSRRRKFVLTGLSDRQIVITSCESEEYRQFGANIIEVSNGAYDNTEA